MPENESGVHRVLFFKRQDGCHELKILGFEIGDGERLLELPPVSGRRIEVYGDSVSAGESVEAIDFTGKTDPEHEGGFSNCWFSFPWLTARMLGAELHDIAQGGIALMDGQVVDSMKDEKISHFLFKRNGVATPGHPRIPEQFEMAREMADYIENVLGVYSE